MDFRQLRYFAHIARAGSFKRAASELNVAQPALSRQIRKLEDDLGVELLVRHGRGVRLTSSGSILLDGAEAISNLMAQTGERVKGGSSTATQHVSLGVPPAAGLLIVPPIVKRLREEWPQASLHIREGVGSLLQEWLFDGRINVAVIHNPLPLERLEIQPVLSERMVVIGPKPSKKQIRGDIVKSFRIRDLADLPLIMPSLPHNNRRLLEQAAVQHGIRLRTTLEVDSVVLTKALVKAGLGYSVITYAAVHDEVARGHLRAYPIDHPPLISSMAVATLQGARLSPAAAALPRLLKMIVREQVESGAWRCAPGSVRDTVVLR